MPSSSLVVLAVVGVAGLLLLIVASRFDLPWLIGPGLLLFAVGTWAAAAHAIVTRYVVERSRETARSVTFQGIAAILIGIVLISLGLAFAAAGIAFVVGQEEALLAFLLARPGAPLLISGIALGAAGAARIFGAREWRGSLKSILAALPERIAGVLLVLVSMLMVMVGAFELIAPSSFDAVVESLLEPLDQAPGARPP
jgi:uncharacterized membrane protein